MNTVIKKKDLLVVLIENKENHREVFLKALVGFQEECVDVLEHKVALLKAKKKTDLFINLPEPEDHTADYDRMINLLNMDVRDDLELTEREFAQYVMDDWGWKDQWTETVMNYTNIGEAG